MVEKLRRIRNQRPFVPYTILLADGRQVHIRDQFHVAFGGTLVSIYDEPSDDFIYVYDPDISDIKVDGLVVGDKSK